MKKQPKQKITLQKVSQELNAKIDATRAELQTTRTEINNRIGFLSSEMGQIDSRMVTKDDLKGFATKDDLKGFATKDDLKGFATKDDLKGFATKDDISRVALAIQRNQSDIDEIKTNMATKGDFQKIMIAIDTFEKDRKILFDNDEIQRGYLRDHESRIAVLEASEKRSA